MTRTARGRRTQDGATKRARATQRPTEKSSRVKGVSGRDRSTSAWRSFLHDRSVRSRVAALVLLPMLGTLVLGTMFFKNALDDTASASRVQSLAEVGLVAVEALTSIQDERDVSGLAEAGGTGDGAKQEARAETDAALERLAEAIDERRGEDLGAAFEGAVVAFEREMGRLDGYRSQRDAANPPFDQGGTSGYHRFAGALQRMISAASSVTDDPQLARRISSVSDIAQAVESASMERGLVAYFIEPGAVPTAEQRDQAIVLQGEQDLLLVGRFLSGFGFSEQARIYSNQIFVGDREVATARSDVANGTQARTTKEDWYTSATTRLDSLREIEHDSAQRVVDQAAEATDSARLTAILSAAAVLIVLGLTVYLTVVVARSIIGPLRRLRASALETAQTHLPALVERVHKDGPAAARNIDPAVAAEGRDEIGQVGTAFNDVHSTAVRVAAEQALLRQNLDTIVVNLSRRTQSLVDRQLGEIEGLEQRERDPDQLSTLFRIDHMATRVRRHAESLLVLAGVDEMRKHTSAAGVLDVVRTAVGEVEQYPRVKFGVMPTDLIAANAVDDIAHLLAELIDNATEFSAPATPVRVTSQPLLGGGLRLQVTDAGLGIPADQLDELNERLRNVGDIDVAASRTLGLYVVARLAAKHGIRVRLEAVAEGGTAAQVDLPAHLILSPLDTNEGIPPVSEETEPPSTAGTGAATAGAAAATPGTGPQPVFGRHDDSSPALPSASTSGASADFPSLRREAEAAETRFAADVSRPPSETRVSGETPSEPAETRFSTDPGRRPAEAERPMWPASHSSDRGKPVEPLEPSTDPSSWRHQSTPASASAASSVSSPPPAAGSTTPPLDGATGFGDRGSRLSQPAPPGATPPPPTPEPAAARSSLRAPEPELPESDSPIFDSVASAWFSKSDTNRDWSSPADEGWRRAAEALRSAEEAASARRSQRDTAPVPDAATPQPGSGWAASGSEPTPPPAAEQTPAVSASGLPVRRRGASLIPGSIGDAAETARPQQPAAKAKNADTVASTLASLQRGVGRGREETGGWVPKRPSDPERSNS